MYENNNDPLLQWHKIWNCFEFLHFSEVPLCDFVDQVFLSHFLIFSTWM